VRIAIHLFLQDAAARDYEAAAARVLPEDATDETITTEAKRLEKLFAAHATARERFRLDPAGRAAEHTHFDEAEPGAAEWRIAQVLIDPTEANDWEARFVLDLAQTRATARAALRLDTIGEVGGGQ
jgi:hypothetical protein